MQAKGVKPDVLSVGVVMAEIFAEDVKSVEMLVTPLEAGLKHAVELSQSRVASDQESPPDERTDVSKDDAQLICVGVDSLRFHEQSVRRNPLCFKGSPRILALSIIQAIKRDGLAEFACRVGVAA
jgi:hypothetical protein